MKSQIFLFLMCAYAVNGASFMASGDIFQTILEEWNTFKLQYNKTYKSEFVNELRLSIYLDNREKIAKHNEKFEKGLVSFSLGMNQFGDMTTQEFVNLMNGYDRSARTRKSGSSELDEVDAVTFVEPANVELPAEVDWRKQGAVTPVKNQGQCGSCWAFSSTGALEGQHFRHNGSLISLSEQNLVDCSDSFGNMGCDGGLMNYAFNYVKANRGIDTEKSYPYEAKDGSCRYNPRNSGANDNGYVNIPSGSESKLQAAVATVGPISVAIDASAASFQLYHGGVYYEPDCSTDMLDHGVLAVGYGTDPKSKKDYWLVKNSWDVTWGEKGYIRMSRNRNNNCGIATDASYPLVK